MKFNFFFSIVNGRRAEADDSSQLVSLCCQKYETTSFEVGKKRPQRAESLLLLCVSEEWKRVNLVFVSPFQIRFFLSKTLRLQHITTNRRMQ